MSADAKAIDWDALLVAAEAAQANAYAPYSRYHVGCALLADDGRVFTAANVENASFPLGLCAERGAVSAAASAGVRAFRACLIVTPGPAAGSPCGGCRQVLAELGPTFPVRCVALGGQTVDFDRDALLPGAFGPSDLAR